MSNFSFLTRYEEFFYTKTTAVPLAGKYIFSAGTEPKCAMCTIKWKEMQFSATLCSNA